VPGQYRTLAKYRLIAKLGGGGMADAYLGVVSGADGFNKLYVLKVLRDDVDERDRADLLSMFQDEGRLAARLNHPHIVQSFEMGSDDGRHFIAMEYLEGQPLSLLQERWSDDADSFPLDMRLFVIGQLLDGLDYAHNLVDYDGRHLHIVHRDVSPQNVFVTYAGHTKLLDFGIAKTQQSKKTRAGIVKGKIPYMAPEQVRAGALDPRADLFSVGVVLWECITGRPLHTDQNEYDILKRLAEGNLPHLKDVMSDVPPLLDRVVSRALALDPRDRYADARSFREELLSFPGVSSLSTRDIAQRMDVLFAEDRQRITQTIREALHPAVALDSPPSTEAALPILPTAHDHKRGPISTTSPTTAVVPSLPIQAPKESVRVPAELAASSVPSAPARRAAPRWLRVGSAGAAAAIAALALFSSHQVPREPALNASLSAGAPARAFEPPTPTPTPTPRQPTDPVAVPPERLEAALIRLSLSVKPNTATLLLDGKRLKNNPLREARPRDGTSHTLKLSAPGYQEQTLNLTFDADIVRDIELARVVTGPAGPAPGRSEPSWVMEKLPPPPQAAPHPVERR